MIEAGIYPSEGTGSTDILIRFNTRNASVGNVEKADIFWDNFSIVLNEPAVQGADGSYNYHLNVPSEPPLSDLGSHTIRVYSFVSNYGQVSFDFTFRVVEHILSPEYAALNSTYHFLLANYTDLLDNYNLLLANYSMLSTDYESSLTEHSALLMNYNSLSANYNSLLSNFNSLSANYNFLLANYNNLHSLYVSFLANYTNLQGNFDSLSSNYNILRQAYDSLDSSYRDLKSNDALLGELATNRNINYIFITTTFVLAMVIIYQMRRKQKPTTRTRY